MIQAIENLFLKYRVFIYPLLVIASSVVIIMVLIIPQVKVLFMGQGRLSNSEERLSVLEVKAKELEDLDGNDLSQKLSFALAAMPTEKDYASLIGVFKGLTTASGMSLTSIHLAGGSENENAFLVKAELIGAKTVLGRLLENIEKSPRVMKVQSVETTSSGSGDTIFVMITVKAYFESAPQTLGPIDSALPKLTDTDQVVLGTLVRSGSTVNTGPILLPSGKSNPFE